MARKNISSGTIWESVVGYSRAVRVDNFVFVTGTIAADESGTIISPGNVYEQTVYAIRKIERALQEAGAELTDVVRTRLLVTDVSKWEEIAKAHMEFFGNIKPATTMVEVSRLMVDDALIEIEVDAVITE